MFAGSPGRHRLVKYFYQNSSKIFLLEYLLIQDAIALPVHLVENFLVVRNLRLLLGLRIGDLHGTSRRKGGAAASSGDRGLGFRV